MVASRVSLTTFHRAPSNPLSGNAMTQLQLSSRERISFAGKDEPEEIEACDAS